MSQRLTRREMLESTIAWASLILGAPASGESQAPRPTPSAVMGRFFKKGAPNQRTLRSPGDAGLPLDVAGRIMNTRGDALHGVTIDVWQADHAGHYDFEGYRYRAKLALGSQTAYAIETVMPGRHPDRPVQHIHFIVSAPGHKMLVTQLYFADDPFFEGAPDKNYHKDSIVEQRELIRPVKLCNEPGAARAAVEFNICLERA